MESHSQSVFLYSFLAQLEPCKINIGSLLILILESLPLTVLSCQNYMLMSIYLASVAVKKK